MEGVLSVPWGRKQKKKSFDVSTLVITSILKSGESKGTKEGKVHSEKKAIRAVLWLDSQGRKPHFIMTSLWEHGCDHLLWQQYRQSPVASLLLCDHRCQWELGQIATKMKHRWKHLVNSKHTHTQVNTCLGKPFWPSPAYFLVEGNYPRSQKNYKDN